MHETGGEIWNNIKDALSSHTLPTIQEKEKSIILYIVKTKDQANDKYTKCEGYKPKFGKICVNHPYPKGAAEKKYKKTCKENNIKLENEQNWRPGKEHRVCIYCWKGFFTTNPSQMMKHPFTKKCKKKDALKLIQFVIYNLYDSLEAEYNLKQQQHKNRKKNQAKFKSKLTHQKATVIRSSDDEDQDEDEDDEKDDEKEGINDAAAADDDENGEEDNDNNKKKKNKKRRKNDSCNTDNNLPDDDDTEDDEDGDTNMNNTDKTNSSKATGGNNSGGSGGKESNKQSKKSKTSKTNTNNNNNNNSSPMNTLGPIPSLPLGPISLV